MGVGVGAGVAIEVEVGSGPGDGGPASGKICWQARASAGGGVPTKPSSAGAGTTGAEVGAHGCADESAGKSAANSVSVPTVPAIALTGAGAARI